MMQIKPIGEVGTLLVTAIGKFPNCWEFELSVGFSFIAPKGRLNGRIC